MDLTGLSVGVVQGVAGGVAVGEGVSLGVFGEGAGSVGFEMGGGRGASYLLFFGLLSGGGFGFVV